VLFEHCEIAPPDGFMLLGGKESLGVEVEVEALRCGGCLHFSFLVHSVSYAIKSSAPAHEYRHPSKPASTLGLSFLLFNMHVPFALAAPYYLDSQPCLFTVYHPCTVYLSPMHSITHPQYITLISGSVKGKRCSSAQLSGGPRKVV
jgi:hypothetical protein